MINHGLLQLNSFSAALLTAPQISSLLAGIPNPNFSFNESYITQGLTKHIKHVSYATSRHGRRTMTDSSTFPLYPAMLDEMPIKLRRESDTAKNDKCSPSKKMGPRLEFGSLGQSARPIKETEESSLMGVIYLLLSRSMRHCWTGAAAFFCTKHSTPTGPCFW